MIDFSKKSNLLVNFFYKSFPILFLMNLIGLFNLDYHNLSFNLIAASPIFTFAFVIDKMAMIFLCLLNFIWLIFVFYSNSFLKIEENKNSYEIKLFATFIFFAVVLNILAKNLITILFSYHLLLFFCYIFSLKFTFLAKEKDIRKLKLFGFLLYFLAIFFFFAVALTYKFSTEIDVVSIKELIAEINMAKQFAIFSFYFLSLLSLSIFPLFLLYSKFSENSLINYLLFFVALAFVPLYIFIKIISVVFGFDSFAKLILELGFSYFEMMFLITIFASAILLILSKNLKSSFFYIIFNQFAATSLILMAFAIFDKTKIFLPLISFTLSITLIFLCLSNFILYLSKAEFKSIKNLLYELKITSSLLIFGVLNMLGIIPGVGMMQNFFLIKMIFTHELSLFAIILVINFILILSFSFKIFYLLLTKVENSKSSNDLELIKTIDYDSGLILTSLVIALVILFSPIVFLIKNTLFNL
jgi:formate hydrogenlyase subunit 3/multisubunit Na+/H+ antiporter MnhD subunit